MQSDVSKTEPGLNCLGKKIGLVLRIQSEVYCKFMSSKVTLFDIETEMDTRFMGNWRLESLSVYIIVLFCATSWCLSGTDYSCHM
jgi:hypothetical protein